MLKVTRRLGRLSGFIAAGVAIAATGSGVMAASYSTFNAQTANPTNSWNSGTLALTDDDAGAMFTVSTATLSGNKCIKVSSTGSYTGIVKLYSTNFSNTNALGDHINMKIEVGSAAGLGTFADCTGFVASGAAVFDGKLKAFDTASNSYANGASTGWSTTAGTPDARVFRFTWSYDDTAPQGSTASDTFTWEAHTL